MIYIAGWVLLWFKPFYQFLLFFAGALGVLAIFLGVLPAAPENRLFAVVAAALNVCLFLIVGAGVVALRKWMASRAKVSGKEKALDAEMARIRADIAARDGTPPTGAN
ncbi:MAG: hypothetical protein IV086_01780 [Hyphomonadaceae bacterium]|nr:hypothetical protein [Hyphomonadaceae bacterium]